MKNVHILIMNQYIIVKQLEAWEFSDDIGYMGPKCLLRSVSVFL